MRVVGTSASDLALAADILRSGGLVAIPTETVYGLAGNVWEPKTLARIFEAKNRPQFDPLIVHVANPDNADEVADLSLPHARQLAEALWPGPLTMVLPRKPRVPDLATSGLSTVGVRCP
ncbi:MAG TPA: L-threonylcarbamoyladenylate synthase, partial [Spirochaetales bacterium]|nr:L-threonylcarbamoyladenylate synthase [Spirochaetales bacterium]